MEVINPFSKSSRLSRTPPDMNAEDGKMKQEGETDSEHKTSIPNGMTRGITRVITNLPRKLLSG